MTNNHNNGHQKGSSSKAVIGFAAGLVAAAAAGAYFLYGSKNSKKYRSLVIGWMFKAKGEILQEIEKLQDVTKEQYENIVEAIAKKYKDVESIDGDDVNRFVVDLKKQWGAIAKSLSAKKKASKKNGASSKK